MRQLFKNWEDLNRACEDENTIWGQMGIRGDEILVYRDPMNEDLMLSEQPEPTRLLVSDETIEDPDWVLVEY